LPSTPEKLFDFHDDIRSAMVVDRIGNVLAFASRTGNPVDPAFVKDITAKWTAMLGGMLRGTEASWGVLKWVHLRFNKLHVYGWVINEGYLVFTARNQLEDPLLDAIATSSVARSLYADKWNSNGKEG
jgi:hypothetical protein